MRRSASFRDAAQPLLVSHAHGKPMLLMAPCPHLEEQGVVGIHHLDLRQKALFYFFGWPVPTCMHRSTIKSHSQRAHAAPPNLPPLACCTNELVA